MNFVEMFSGIGGMGYGLMRAGWNCVGYAEWDKYAHRSYEILHDPNRRMWNRYNVRYVSNRSLRNLGRKRGPIHLIAAGFPCQSFSIAGKRKGFTDTTRGTLFFEVLRWASILKPRYLLLENVEGLLNHDGGRTFGTILGSLDEMGYVGEWCVLNSSSYVPQNRERIFIVASLGGNGGRKIFPFGSENGNSVEVIGRVDIKADDYCKRVYSTNGLSPYLPTMQGGSQEPKVMVVGNTNPSGNGMNGQVFDSDGLAPTLTTNKGEGNKILVQKPNWIPGTEDINRTLRTGGKSSLSAKHNCDYIHDGYRIRKLTPLECFRLQSYPDEWYQKLKSAGISDSQLYKMAGNGVTSEVAYQIGKRIYG